MPAALVYVTAVSLVAGLGLFLVPPLGHMPLPYQVALTGAALVVWSFLDGLFGRFSVLLALLEGALLLRLALSWADLLVTVLGTPVEGTRALLPP
ncbi:hypothetical protein D9599_26050 [Roseomonas sp. KE2513]|uniref:hypothetical protein n=1 Tax=Roseomonas sp. KE2513 TaxID=2479202 RepID=UPI0018DF14B6|nr:hypothetical protein [Roseomonas sp. KE2513]MBI0539014.1 hypothetical protein [Roseomonas sp. KE2513]